MQLKSHIAKKRSIWVITDNEVEIFANDRWLDIKQHATTWCFLDRKIWDLTNTKEVACLFIV